LVGFFERETPEPPTDEQIDQPAEPPADECEKREVEAATELFQGLAQDLRGKTPKPPISDPRNNGL